MEDSENIFEAIGGAREKFVDLINASSNAPKDVQTLKTLMVLLNLTTTMYLLIPLNLTPTTVILSWMVSLKTFWLIFL